MQVSMVDSVSGSDLFTPTSVPKLGSDSDVDRSLREIFGEDYPSEYPERRAWPDTDQDVDVGRPAVSQPYGAHDLSGPVPEPAAQPAAAAPPVEDHLGVGSQVPKAEVEETTPIYEEMVSAWFRELSPPAPAVARPAPTYVEPPPFELPAWRSTPRRRRRSRTCPRRWRRP